MCALKLRSNFDELLAVYRGRTVDALRSSLRTTTSGAVRAALVYAVEGKVYFVSVTSFGEILGDFTLRWYPGESTTGRRELTAVWHPTGLHC
jgi:hypothetical protein